MATSSEPTGRAQEAFGQEWMKLGWAMFKGENADTEVVTACIRSVVAARLDAQNEMAALEARLATSSILASPSPSKASVVCHVIPGVQ